MNAELKKIISRRKFQEFEKYWLELRPKPNAADKRQILFEIIEDYYQDKDYLFYMDVFELIIDDKLNLNFEINHMAPSLTALAVEKASLILLDYLICKGADINFVGDVLAYDKEPDYDMPPALRFSTCLDYAYFILSEALLQDLKNSFYKPGKFNDWRSMDDKEHALVSKKKYYQLLETQDTFEYATRVYSLSEYLKSIGAKRYSELRRRKK